MYILTFQKAIVIVFFTAATAAVLAVMVELWDSSPQAIKQIIIKISTTHAKMLCPVLQSLWVPAWPHYINTQGFLEEKQDFNQLQYLHQWGICRNTCNPDHTHDCTQVRRYHGARIDVLWQQRWPQEIEWLLTRTSFFKINDDAMTERIRSKSARQVLFSYGMGIRAFKYIYSCLLDRAPFEGIAERGKSLRTEPENAMQQYYCLL